MNVKDKFFESLLAETEGEDNMTPQLCAHRRQFSCPPVSFSLFFHVHVYLYIYILCLVVLHVWLSIFCSIGISLMAERAIGGDQGKLVRALEVE